MQFIVNAVGWDRPGIVSEITQKVTQAGGNVGESQAARLGDYFSLMMFVSAPSNQAESLRASLLEQDSLDGLNASVFDAPTTTTDNAKPISPAIGCELFCCLYLYTWYLSCLSQPTFFLLDGLVYYSLFLLLCIQIRVRFT